MNLRFNVPSVAIIPLLGFMTFNGSKLVFKILINTMYARAWTMCNRTKAKVYPIRGCTYPIG